MYKYNQNNLLPNEIRELNAKKFLHSFTKRLKNDLEHSRNSNRKKQRYIPNKFAVEEERN